MKHLTKNNEDRQRELRAWAVERGLSLTSLARECGVKLQVLNQSMLRGSMRLGLRNRLLALGVPERLLPDVLQSKAALLDENRALRARLAELEPGSGTAA